MRGAERIMSLILLIIILTTGSLVFVSFSLMRGSLLIKSQGVILFGARPLHVEGRYIENDLGETVRLRGVNQQGYVDHPSGYWRPVGEGLWSGGTWNYFPQSMLDNLDEMKRWGFNSIRVHQAIQFWLDNTENYRQHFKEMLTEAGKRGMYVIFDAYSIRPYPNIHQHPLPYVPFLDSGYPGDDAVMPDRAAFVNYWISVASELKDFPNVIFEIYNEPHGNTATEAEYFSMAQEVINAVREIGATQIIVVQWGYSVWANLYMPDAYRSTDMDVWISEYPLIDPSNNLLYSAHNYRAYGQFHYSLSGVRLNVWNYSDIKLGYNSTGVLSTALQHPVLNGEFGADGSDIGTDEWPKELAYLNNSLTLFEEYGINWAVMTWTTPSHIRFGLLQNAVWIPPPNDAGLVVMQALSG